MKNLPPGLVMLGVVAVAAVLCALITAVAVTAANSDAEATKQAQACASAGGSWTERPRACDL